MELPVWLADHRVIGQSLSMDDVVGLRAPKREVESLIARIQHPEVLRRAGAQIPRGVLFAGPPGTGKSYLARAMASRLAELSPETEFYSIAAATFDQSRFEELSRYLRQRPPDAPLLVIYIDEIDLWARTRDDYRSTDQSRATLFAALATLDGLDDRGADRVLWLASTNRAEEIDDALVRPGRFGFTVRLREPRPVERLELFRFYARNRPVDDGIDWDHINDLTPRRTTPAAIRQALDDALALAIADEGHEARIQQRHVLEAILREGRIEDEDAPWSEAQTRAIATHEAGHALVAAMLGTPLQSLSLRPHGGLTISGDPSRDTVTSRGVADRLATTLAGTVAEAVVLGDVSMGGLTDTHAATALARYAIGAGLDGSRPMTYRPFDDSVMAMDEEFLLVATALNQARQRATRVIAMRVPAVRDLADLLIEKRQLTGGELTSALEFARRTADDDDGPAYDWATPSFTRPLLARR